VQTLNKKILRGVQAVYNEVVTRLTDNASGFMRNFFFFVYFLTSLCYWPCAIAAQGTAAPALVAAPSAVPLIALSRLNAASLMPLMAYTGVPVAMTIEQVAARSSETFSPFDPKLAHSIDLQHSLWLHFRVAVEPGTVHTGWMFELAKPLLNSVEFYYRNTQDVWQVQKSGISVPYAHWPQHGLYPQFQLPLLAAGEHDFFIKIQHDLPVRFAARLWPNDAANQTMQLEFLLIGLMLGLMALMAVITGMFSIAYHDSTYGWYALYVTLGMATCASFVGLGNYLVSSQSMSWPEALPPLFLMASFALQLQFCRAMFVPPASSTWIHTGVSALLVLSVVAMGMLWWMRDLRLREAVFVVQSTACIATMLAIAVRALRYRKQVAGLWLVAYLPLIVVVALTVLENFGWVALPWLPYKAPMYALMFEMLVLLVALHLHAKTTHSRDVRSTTLAGTDPLTGFVPAHLYPDMLTQLWLKALQAKSDFSVAYVLATTHQPERTGGGSIDKKRATLRTVRMLRTVAHEDDTIARVDDDLFAILMPGMGRSEALTNKLARLVALGIMEDKDDRGASQIQFKVLASSLRSFTGSPNLLHSTMQVAMKMPSTWAQRSIRFFPESID
jgi:two-component system, sensor histidine kinase LadS